MHQVKINEGMKSRSALRTHGVAKDSLGDCAANGATPSLCMWVGGEWSRPQKTQNISIFVLFVFSFFFKCLLNPSPHPSAPPKHLFPTVFFEGPVSPPAHRPHTYSPHPWPSPTSKSISHARPLVPLSYSPSRFISSLVVFLPKPIHILPWFCLSL